MRYRKDSNGYNKKCDIPLLMTDHGEKASKKITERQLNRYGHAMRRDGEHILRKVLRMDTCDVYQGKGREDDRKLDGKMRANET